MNMKGCNEDLERAFGDEVTVSKEGSQNNSSGISIKIRAVDSDDVI